MSSPLLSIILPTRNEEANVLPLFDELTHALASEPYTYELIFVDASTDGTGDILAKLAMEQPHVRHIRSPLTRQSLAHACVEGFSAAHGQYVCVMDADLQHPPSALPRLLEALVLGAHVAVGTRYGARGHADGLASSYRRTVSRASARFVHALIPRTRATSDPLSGFFAFKRSIIQDTVLQPLGFKILVELLARTAPARTADVPYTFRPRRAGKSKAGLMVGLAFIAHVWRLRRVRNTPLTP